VVQRFPYGHPRLERERNGYRRRLCIFLFYLTKGLLDYLRSDISPYEIELYRDYRLFGDIWNVADGIEIFSMSTASALESLGDR
jgi:hypothetical protein